MPYVIYVKNRNIYQTLLFSWYEYNAAKQTAHTLAKTFLNTERCLLFIC